MLSKRKNDRGFRFTKSFTWIAPSILVAGICTWAVTPSVKAEPSTLSMPQNLQSQNLQPPARQRPVREVLSYEMKGDELRICKQQGNSEKKCEVVGKGYTLGLRTANDLYNQGNVANAEILYRQLIARFPKQGDAYYKLGTVLSAAVAALKKAQELFVKQGRVSQANRVEQILQEINARSSGS